MGAGHTHSGTDARISRMVSAAVLLAGFFAVELSTALLIGSIALLADAGHLLTDLTAAVMGLAALMLARRGSSSPRRTYGWHRAEVFTAVANAVLLIGIAAFNLDEAVRRLDNAPAIPGVPMIAVALGDLATNTVAALLLRVHSTSSLAVKGAYMEVVAEPHRRRRAARGAASRRRRDRCARPARVDTGARQRRGDCPPDQPRRRSAGTRRRACGAGGAWVAARHGSGRAAGWRRRLLGQLVVS